MALHEHPASGNAERWPFSPPDFLDLQRDQQSFEGVEAFVNVPFELSGRGDPIRIDGAKVSGKLFSLLGVRPLLGRDFTPDEDRPGMDVAVLSWGLWQSRYGGDRSIVGQTVTLDRRPYTVSDRACLRRGRPVLVYRVSCRHSCAGRRTRAIARASVSHRLVSISSCLRPFAVSR